MAAITHHKRHGENGLAMGIKPAEQNIVCNFSILIQHKKQHLL